MLQVWGPYPSPGHAPDPGGAAGGRGLDQKTPEGAQASETLQTSSSCSVYPSPLSQLTLRVVLWAAGPCPLPHRLPRQRLSGAPLVGPARHTCSVLGSGLRRAPMHVRPRWGQAWGSRSCTSSLIPAGGIRGGGRQGLGGFRIQPKTLSGAFSPCHLPGPSVEETKAASGFWHSKSLGNLTWLQPSCQLVRPNLCPGCAPRPVSLPSSAPHSQLKPQVTWGAEQL